MRLAHAFALTLIALVSASAVPVTEPPTDNGPILAQTPSPFLARRRALDSTGLLLAKREVSCDALEEKMAGLTGANGFLQFSNYFHSVFSALLRQFPGVTVSLTPLEEWRACLEQQAIGTIAKIWAWLTSGGLRDADPVTREKVHGWGCSCYRQVYATVTQHLSRPKAPAQGQSNFRGQMAPSC